MCVASFGRVYAAAAGCVKAFVRDRPAAPPARGEEPEPISHGAPKHEPAPVPERIAIAELRQLWERGEPVTLLDVRTERSYRDDPEIARGAFRVPPDDAVRLARERGLDPGGTLVLYCT